MATVNRLTLNYLILASRNQYTAPFSATRSPPNRDRHSILIEMGSNFRGEEDHHHAINIWEVNKDRLELMERRISAAPGILNKSAGRSSCCIFKVPKSLKDVNGEHYQPRIVSIGPYHHGEPQLAMVEEHKWRVLGILLTRTQIKGLNLEDYLRAVQPFEAQARECYSEAFQFNTDEFMEMLVLDGCFIIELFRKIGEVVTFDQDDPLFSMSWVYSFFRTDLIRLENQIPFFVLECLFDLSMMPDEEGLKPLGWLTLNFFNNVLERREETLREYCYNSLDSKHILDFLQSSFIPRGYEEPRPGSFSNTRTIQCISYLRRAGINLKPGTEDSFLAIKFRRGVLEMPTISVDDFMSSFLLNCVAYEQCHGSSSKHMTAYVSLLDCLINTVEDVQCLCHKNIIKNYFGTDAEIATFVNNMGKDVSMDMDMCYLSSVFNEVNQYYFNSWHVQWARFKYMYFNTNWLFISALAAFVLLVLTVLQTLYTILGYVRSAP